MEARFFATRLLVLVLAGGAQQWSPQGQPELVEEVWSVAAVFTRGHWPLPRGPWGTGAGLTCPGVCNVCLQCCVEVLGRARAHRAELCPS